jgi:hypothetical protein
MKYLKILNFFMFNGSASEKKKQGMIENYIRIVG